MASAYPGAVLTCAICGRTAACVVSKATDKPWCLACKQRWIRCTGCGEVAPLRGGTLDEPLCSLCTRPDNAWRSCAGCGQPGRLHHGRCARCSVTTRLHELLADDTGAIPADREVLYRVAGRDQAASHAERLARQKLRPPDAA
ncbi:hypothetical protein [Mycobacterium sp. 29Ha]|uniref:hypothetical protein n=1 Tax=Mycobacterium sp. 29Ha TaxID=2939268 RepID=UPI0029392F8E|nr:hypothetical protein [Mycobacterium sp. 29Ha]MDV3133260.1 hypothetical protein [Mycobacterium sp. 29Ha]